MGRRRWHQRTATSDLTVKYDGQTSILYLLYQGETATIEPDVWHDWWNAGDRDVRVEVTRPPRAGEFCVPVRCGMQRTTTLCVMGAVVMATMLVHAQTPDRTITCTGTLIDVAMRSKVWSLAVIYDAAGGYTCTVDRSGSRHDPMRPCSMGDTCRLVGIYSRKIDTNYFIDRISSVDIVEGR